MAATQFAVVYATATNVILRIIEPYTNGVLDPDDSHMQVATAALAAGESIKILALTNFPVRTKATLQNQIGIPASDARCALVNAQGKVINVIMADTSITTAIEIGTVIVPSETAGIGASYNRATGVFTAPSASGAPSSGTVTP